MDDVSLKLFIILYKSNPKNKITSFALKNNIYNVIKIDVRKNSQIDLWTFLIIVIWILNYMFSRKPNPAQFSLQEISQSTLCHYFWYCYYYYYFNVLNSPEWILGYSKWINYWTGRNTIRTVVQVVENVGISLEIH